VSSRGRTVKEASDAKSKLMAAMTSALLESGIDQKDVQTSRFSLSRTYAHIDGNLLAMIVYRSALIPSWSP
jgi:uncharacterized protein YggE